MPPLNQRPNATPATSRFSGAPRIPAETRYEECFETGGKIPAGRLGGKGYRLTVRFIRVNKDLRIYELLALDSAREAEMCFLVRDIRSHGVVIAGSFRAHNNFLISRTARFKNPPTGRLEILPTPAAPRPEHHKPANVITSGISRENRSV